MHYLFYTAKLRLHSEIWKFIDLKSREKILLDFNCFVGRWKMLDRRMEKIRFVGVSDGQ